MKRFTLEVDGMLFQVEGNSLKEVEGWENGVPEIWKKNKKKIKEEDISAEIEDRKERKDLSEQLSELLVNKKVLKKYIKHLKRLRDEPDEPVVEPPVIEPPVIDEPLKKEK